MKRNTKQLVPVFPIIYFNKSIRFQNTYRGNFFQILLYYRFLFHHLKVSSHTADQSNGLQNINANHEKSIRQLSYQFQRKCPLIRTRKPELTFPERIRPIGKSYAVNFVSSPAPQSPTAVVKRKYSGIVCTPASSISDARILNNGNLF